MKGKSIMDLNCLIGQHKTKVVFYRYRGPGDICFYVEECTICGQAFNHHTRNHEVAEKLRQEFNTEMAKKFRANKKAEKKKHGITKRKGGLSI